MDNYLKGKAKLKDSTKHLESIRAIADAKSGFPMQTGNRMEITSEEGQPKVECITEDGRVTKILVTCKCGEQIELSCKYG
jgi:hypothetical protein